MYLLKEIEFEYEEKRYKIKAFQDGEKVIVRVFLKNNPVSPITYTVSIDTNFKLKVQQGQEGFEALMEIAKEDFIKKPWEEVV